MPDFPINVVIDPSNAVRGGRRVEKALNDIEDMAGRVQSMITRALAFTGVSFGLSGLANILDEYTNFENRIRAVTKSTAELNVVSEELFQISQRTRTALDGNAVLYQRTADSIKRYGFSIKETFQFIEAYNQALILGGGSAKESTAATIQFAQGMGAGALRGEELNSVMEQSAVIADIIAAQFGVTRGELKSLGEQGKLTTQQIVEGFLKARKELGDRFAAAIPTISQAFTVLRNALVRTVGTYDQGAGASRLFAQSIIYLADNVDTIIRLFGAAAMVIGIQFATQAVPRAVSAVISLTAAIAANPLGALVIAITTIISLLTVFSDKISVSADDLVTLRDLGVVAWEGIKDATASFINFFNEHFGDIAALAKEVFSDINFSMESILKFGAKAADMFLGIWRGAYLAIKVLFQQLPLIIQKAWADGINSLASDAENDINAIISKVNYLRGKLGMDAIGFLDFDRVGLNFKAPAEDLGKEMGKAFSDGFNVTVAQDALASGLTRAREIADERRKMAAIQNEAVDLNKKEVTATGALDKAKGKLKITFDQLYAALVREGEALRLSNSEREIALGLNRMEEQLKRKLTESEYKRADAQLRLNQQLQIQADLFDQIRGPIVEYKESVAALNALMEKGRISQQEYNMALSQTSLADQLSGVRTDLSRDPEAANLQALQDQLLERQLILQQAREAELLSEQEFHTLSLEATRRYNEEIVAIEQNRFHLQMQNASSVFGSMADLAKNYAGEQSGIYKRLFALSKAFAIADATVQIANAIAKAANSGPFPYNLGAMTSVAAATSSLVSAISGVELAFQNGGSFKVGGSGGTDSQLVQFRASPNETVTVRTPGQEKQQQNQPPAKEQPLVIRPINVFDPSIVGDFLTSSEGDRVFINMIQRNSSAIKSIQGG